MSSPPVSAEHIRRLLERVDDLREQARRQNLVGSVQDIKRLQGRRFRGTYQDMLRNPGRAPAARFFLEELYSERDFSERDRQFGKIAGAIERLFPEEIVRLACDLAELHALTESLDLTMATHWCGLPRGWSEARRYLHAWRSTGEEQGRARQLSVVRHLGDELDRLTRRKSLRIALRMMRRPAELAGLGALQHFLEQGFDAFAGLDNASFFLEQIESREGAWLRRLYLDPEGPTCEMLAQVLTAGDRAD
ncbi:MAG TPA: hypothetical protein PKA21_16015 [Kiritimatiellia bacterium]|uniref:FFLEELY motif protein n=1 Tax=Hydrogenophaga sp. TaxID=1904254 RepID=UPI002BF1863B|nr:hypothetical protein [Hydrogenophaga sp.]HMO52613.1 hypothetical protein [Kiritimatiellia bacterium]HMP11325.1 hypothetical protein [Hydrogenophaga sp.]